MMRTIFAGFGLLAALVSIALPVGAAGGRMHWQGDVDDKADIHIRGSRVWTTGVTGQGIDKTRWNFRRNLPMRRTRCTLEKREGRGNLRIIQQPRPGNDYTAVVRIEDPQSGRGHYNFFLDW